VQMARRSGQVDDDDGLRRPSLGAWRPLSEQRGQADAEEAGVADLQELAVVDADAVAMRHRASPQRRDGGTSIHSIRPNRREDGKGLKLFQAKWLGGVP